MYNNNINVVMYSGDDGVVVIDDDDDDDDDYADGGNNNTNNDNDNGNDNDNHETNNEIMTKINIIMCQTDYGAEEARKLLIASNGDEIAVIRMYLGTATSLTNDAMAPKPKSKNQLIYQEIRKFMDGCKENNNNTNNNTNTNTNTNNTVL